MRHMAVRPATEAVVRAAGERAGATILGDDTAGEIGRSSTRPPRPRRRGRPRHQQRWRLRHARNSAGRRWVRVRGTGRRRPRRRRRGGRAHRPAPGAAVVDGAVPGPAWQPGASNVTGSGSPRNSRCPRFWPTWPTWPTGTPGRGRRPRRPGAASNPPA